jgi:hypothetical protein
MGRRIAIDLVRHSTQTPYANSSIKVYTSGVVREVAPPWKVHRCGARVTAHLPPHTHFGQQARRSSCTLPEDRRRRGRPRMASLHPRPPERESERGPMRETCVQVGCVTPSCSNRTRQRGVNPLDKCHRNTHPRAVHMRVSVTLVLWPTGNNAVPDLPSMASLQGDGSLGSSFTRVWYARRYTSCAPRAGRRDR